MATVLIITLKYVEGVISIEILLTNLEYIELINALKSLAHSKTFILLLTIIVVDIITGKAKAFKMGSLDSSVGTNGIIKHTIIIILVLIVGIWCRILGVGEFSVIFCVFIILEYLTSIIENVDVLGIKIPKSFRKYFNRLHDQIDNKEM